MWFVRKDGSKSDDGLGHAVGSPNLQRQRKMNSNSSLFCAELSAICDTEIISRDRNYSSLSPPILGLHYKILRYIMVHVCLV